jgi:hypothetical protein
MKSSIMFFLDFNYWRHSAHMLITLRTGHICLPEQHKSELVIGSQMPQVSALGAHYQVLLIHRTSFQFSITMRITISI